MVAYLVVCRVVDVVAISPPKCWLAQISKVCVVAAEFPYLATKPQWEFIFGIVKSSAYKFLPLLTSSA